ncbi:hypothetical protein J6590_007106 [Homalodisca vitripennis]|nr:hypothetical protein J6590_007106 [Homalodisca vitripennis]
MWILTNKYYILPMKCDMMPPPPMTSPRYATGAVHGLIRTRGDRVSRSRTSGGETWDGSGTEHKPRK